MPVKQFFQKNKLLLATGSSLLILIALSGLLVYQSKNLSDRNNTIAILTQKRISLLKQNTDLDQRLTKVLSEDQYVKNKKQEEEINKIHDTYLQTVKTYESLLKLQDSGGDTNKLNGMITSSLTFLADRNYTSASAVLTAIDSGIQKEYSALAQKASAFSISTNIPASNTPPSSGFNRQKVTTEKGDFMVDIISADLSSTRVVVDTASDSDCKDNCPVLSLSDYVSRSNAFAGINGSYFCPATYPSCAGKTNSFDLLLMNKNKHYFNSDNNVYSTNPVAIFGNGWIRFVQKGSDWGRDTGVDGVLMNYPLLIFNKQITFGGNDDTKMTGKGPRSFIANRDNTVYIGYVYNATMSESALVMKSMEMDNALNLDEGGSSALWYGGYKIGPGRNIPNAILFVRK